MDCCPCSLFNDGLPGSQYIKPVKVRLQPNHKVIVAKGGGMFSALLKHSAVREGQRDRSPLLGSRQQFSAPALLKIIEPQGQGETLGVGQLLFRGKQPFPRTHHHAFFRTDLHPRLIPASGGNVRKGSLCYRGGIGGGERQR